ncbi:MAG TPA: nucleoside-diphosphate kinase [Candidatus Saccharimonadales bacterium]|nr:nucleoside-diphosphate kinase [Candidatus Saccharimonadales bacterium]
MQRTVVLLKPDAIQRGLIGEIILRFEQKGIKIVGLKMITASDAILEEHYAHHKDKPFFEALKKFMKSAPIVCMLLEGIDVVEVVRKMAGVTNSRNADMGTIRGDLSISTSTNIIHASDGVEAAKEEEARFFDAGEIMDWERAISPFLYADDEK